MRRKLKIINKGFTLIELLVVIAIIGVLSTVVLSSLNSARTKAKNAAATAAFAQIEKAAQMDFNEYGNYAPDVGPGGNPRFVGTYLKQFDASYYCSTCQYDWNNWPPGTGGSTGTCVFVEIYLNGRRRAIDVSGCPGKINT